MCPVWACGSQAGTVTCGLRTVRVARLVGQTRQAIEAVADRRASGNPKGHEVPRSAYRPYKRSNRAGIWDQRCCWTPRGGRPPGSDVMAFLLWSIHTMGAAGVVSRGAIRLPAGARFLQP